jgi:hypothetical protein
MLPEYTKPPPPSPVGMDLITALVTRAIARAESMQA